jgi:hypothetical protein
MKMKFFKLREEENGDILFQKGSVKSKNKSVY